MTTLHRVNCSDFASNWKFTLCLILSRIENRKKKKKLEKENEVFTWGAVLLRAIRHRFILMCSTKTTSM